MTRRLRLKCPLDPVPEPHQIFLNKIPNIFLKMYNLPESLFCKNNDMYKIFTASKKFLKTCLKKQYDLYCLTTLESLVNTGFEANLPLDFGVILCYALNTAGNKNVLRQDSITLPDAPTRQDCITIPPLHNERGGIMKKGQSDSESNKAILISCIDSILSEISNGNNIELRQAPDGSVKVLVVKKRNLLTATE